MYKNLLSLLILICISLGAYAQNALSFDGEDDYILTDYEGILGTEERTFEAWIYIIAGIESSNMAILDYGENATGSRNTFSVVPQDGILRYISGGVNANMSTPLNSVPNEEWVHVAFVLKDSIGYMYINGIEAGTDDLSTVDTPSNFNTVRIGKRVPGGNIPFSGGIDEVRIWDVARTQDEIQEFMNIEVCEGHPNLKLYMRMNQGISQGDNQEETIAFDESGSENDGELVNFALTGDGSNWVLGTPFTENSINTNVTQESTTLTAEEVDVNYQWVTCPEFTPIEGETNQSFTTNIEGDYAVVLSTGICSLTSDCFTISLTNTEEELAEQILNIFPNPTSGDINISLRSIEKEIKINIRDISGKLILAQEFTNQKHMNINIPNTPGMYIVELETMSTKFVERIVKL